jgi:hypothetical protein
MLTNSNSIKYNVQNTGLIIFNGEINIFFSMRKCSIADRNKNLVKKIEEGVEQKGEVVPVTPSPKSQALKAL